jgi:hypothetical protein
LNPDVSQNTEAESYLKQNVTSQLLKSTRIKQTCKSRMLCKIGPRPFPEYQSSPVNYKVNIKYLNKFFYQIC